jgi:hypothetical protein
MIPSLSRTGARNIPSSSEYQQPVMRQAYRASDLSYIGGVLHWEALSKVMALIS